MSDTTFFSEEVDAELRFGEGPAGPATLRQNGRDIKGTKLP
jgi:hypothetical protein